MADLAELDQVESIEPSAEEIETWPTGPAVAAQLGRTARWVSGMVRAGHFHPRADGNGTRRYDPDEVEALMPSGGTVAIQNQDGIFRILSENARMLASSNAELLRVLPTSLKSLTEGQTELNKQLLDRVKVLETEKAAMAKDTEAASTKREERRLERMKVKRQQKRLDEAFATFKELFPKFLDQLFIGKDLSAFLKGLDPALVDGLLSDEMPLLKPEQKLQLKLIWERMQEAKKKENGQLKVPADKPAEPDKPPAKPEVVA